MNNPPYLDYLIFLSMYQKGLMNWWLEVGYVNINSVPSSGLINLDVTKYLSRLRTTRKRDMQILHMHGFTSLSLFAVYTSVPEYFFVETLLDKLKMIDWLIDWIECYAISAIFQPCHGGNGENY